MHTGGFLGGTVGKNPPLHTGDMVWIPGLEDPTCHGAVKPVLPETRHRNEKLEHHNQERPCSQRPSTRVHAHTTDTHTHTHTHKHIRGGCIPGSQGKSPASWHPLQSPPPSCPRLKPFLCPGWPGPQTMGLLSRQARHQLLPPHCAIPCLPKVGPGARGLLTAGG